MNIKYHNYNSHQINNLINYKNKYLKYNNNKSLEKKVEILILINNKLKSYKIN